MFVCGLRKESMGARLKELLAQGKLVRVFCLGHLCDPKMVEIIGLLGGYDAVWLDPEHCALTLETIQQPPHPARGRGFERLLPLAPPRIPTGTPPFDDAARL